MRAPTPAVPRAAPDPSDRPARRRCISAVALLGVALTACGGEPERAPAAGETPGPGSDTVTSGAPADTDLWLGDIRGEGDSVVVTGLRNVTERPGYDNQPAFLPDGNGLLYTVIDSTGQADIWRYELGADRSVRVTDTRPESEYSPTPLPFGSGFSVVRVEADSTQRLWRFGWQGDRPSVLFPQVQPVGYHAWAGEEWVALYVLGDPPTLRIAGGETMDVREVARDVGRSIQTLPREDAISFVQVISREGSAPDSAAGGEGAPATRIMRWSHADGVSPVIDTPQGGDFHAWTPSGFLLMGDGHGIVAWREGWDRWRTIGTLPVGSTVSRLAVSPNGDRIAVVVEGF